MRHRDAQVEGRLTVRGIEITVLRGVAIGRHRHMESLVDLCHRAINTYQQAIRRWIGYAEAVRSGEPHYSLVILLRGAKLLCELSHRKKMPVIRASWVIKPSQ